MAKATIALGLDRLSVAEEITFGRTIAEGLNDSELGDKTTLSDQVKGATDDLADKESAAKLKASEAQAAITTRDLARANYAEVMKDVAGDVERGTANDAAQMEAIGYTLASTNQSSAVMTKVLDLQLSVGDFPGQLHAQWKPIKGARSYQVQYATDHNGEGATTWRDGMPSTSSKSDLDGLPSNVPAMVRVRAIGSGSGNVGPWSDAAVLAAQ